MKRLLAVSLLALCLCSRALAGDVPFPGKQDPPPPPCTENCTTTTAAIDAEPDDELDLELLVELMLTSLIWP